MRYTGGMQQPKAGFTLVEIVLFSAIFAIVTIAFMSVLVAVVRVQSRQGASNDVNQQSDFVLATIQRAVEQSSHIEGDPDEPGAQAVLRMASSSADPTVISFQGGSIFIERGSGGQEALTTDAVVVTDASFVKRSNPGGKDSLSVSITVSNVTDNPTRSFSRVVEALVSRVSAATFDSDVVPSTGNAFKLGVDAQPWQSINDAIYFSSGNVGIGATSPGEKLEVNGGIRLNPSGGRPTCTSAKRGTIWVTAGSPDTIAACLQTSTSSSNYVWVSL